MLSFLLVLVLCGYLCSKGRFHHTLWISLNLVDTLRALRTVRTNGRRIGHATRTRAMRNSLICWVVFMTCSSVSPVVDRALSWFPFYGPIKLVFTILFMISRLAASTVIYKAFIDPLFRHYETPIDLTLLLIHSLTALFLHFTLFLPLNLVTSLITMIQSHLSLFNPFTFSRSLRRVPYPENNGDDNDQGGVDPDAPETPISVRKIRPKKQEDPPVIVPLKVQVEAKSEVQTNIEPIRLKKQSATLKPKRKTPRTPRPTTPSHQRVNSSTLLTVPTAPMTLRRSPRRASRTDTHNSDDVKETVGKTEGDEGEREEEIQVRALQRLPKAPTTLATISITALPSAPTQIPDDQSRQQSRGGSLRTDSESAPSRSAPSARSVNNPRPRPNVLNSKPILTQPKVPVVQHNRKIQSVPKRTTQTQAQNEKDSSPGTLVKSINVTEKVARISRAVKRSDENLMIAKKEQETAIPAVVGGTKKHVEQRTTVAQQSRAARAHQAKITTTLGTDNDSENTKPFSKRSRPVTFSTNSLSQTRAKRVRTEQ